MNMLRRLSTADRATALSLITAFANQSVLVVSGVLIAHLLGPVKRGHLALLIFMPVVLFQVAHLGLPLAVTYYIAQDLRRTSNVARKILGPAALQALVVVALHLLLLPLFLRGASSRVWTAALLTLVVGPAILAHTSVYRHMNDGLLSSLLII